MDEKSLNNLDSGVKALFPLLPSDHVWHLDAYGLSIYNAQRTEWTDWKKLDNQRSPLNANDKEQLEKYEKVTERANGQKFRCIREFKTVERTRKFWLIELFIPKKYKFSLFYRLKFNEVYITFQPLDARGRKVQLDSSNLTEAAHEVHRLWLDKNANEFLAWLDEKDNRLLHGLPV
jgi:hypothetical protein